MKIFRKVPNIDGFGSVPLLKFSHFMEVESHRWLQKWVTDTFNEDELSVFTYEWLIRSTQVENDPHFFDRIEKPIQKFLGKNPETWSLVRMDVVEEGRFIRIVVFFLSKELTQKQIVEHTWDLWPELKSYRGTFHQFGLIDEFEFYVWATPHRFAIQQVAYIATLPIKSTLSRKLTRRIWEVKPTKT